MRPPEITFPYGTKFIAGKYKYPVRIDKRDQQLWLSFPYNPILLEEVKMMAGARWHGHDPVPVKQWSVDDSQRNWFQISFLEGKNPYARYDRPLLEDRPKRKECYGHQVEGFQHVITRQYCELAFEMGTGKTLISIEAAEWLHERKLMYKAFYVAPKSALTSVQLEYEEWKSIVRPTFLTYEGLKHLMQHWPEGVKPPQFVVFDEASRIKNPMAQRSQAAAHLANAVRREWGEDGMVILMTGTPAPKSPLDWYNQAEIACPGFLKEGSMSKFQRRLAIMKEGQSDAGGVFQQVVTWRDDERKCDKCGLFREDPSHDPISMIESNYHEFTPSVNEVKRLYSRLKGLVSVKFKRDCLADLPEKRYRVIHCKPTQEVINAAKLIAAVSSRTITALTLLRELSDGFQYQDVEIGTEICPLCRGEKIREQWEYVGPEDERSSYYDEDGLLIAGRDLPPDHFQKIMAACSYCSGTGESVKRQREAAQVPCPKEDALADLIDEHEEVGRLVVYAGFTGSIDRCVQLVAKKKWDVIRIDGRGWWSTIPGKAMDLYKAFRYDDSRNIVAVIHPASGGMGLNLTRSPTFVYYSNDFNAESRQQSEDRGHRPGMDLNKGCTIIDLIHLATDLKVRDNLRAKKRLQDLTMGEFRDVLESTPSRGLI